MSGLLVLISVVCVPILGMLAIGQWILKRDRKRQRLAQEKRQVLERYINQT